MLKFLVFQCSILPIKQNLYNVNCLRWLSEYFLKVWILYVAFFAISKFSMFPECSTLVCFSELPNFPDFLVFRIFWPFSFWFSDSWIVAFNSTCNFNFSKFSGCLSFLSFLAFPNVLNFLHVWFLLKNYFWLLWFSWKLWLFGFAGFFVFFLPFKYSENLASEN